MVTAANEREKGLGNSTIFPFLIPGSVLPVLKPWDLLLLLQGGLRLASGRAGGREAPLVGVTQRWRGKKRPRAAEPVPTLTQQATGPHITPANSTTAPSLTSARHTRTGWWPSAIWQLKVRRNFHTKETTRDFSPPGTLPETLVGLDPDCFVATSLSQIDVLLPPQTESWRCRRFCGFAQFQSTWLWAEEGRPWEA